MSGPPREFDAGIDWVHEGKKDTLPLDYACKLLHWKDAYSWPEISHLTHSHPDWKKTYNLAVASINAKTLWHTLVRGKPWVKLPEFLAWAQEKGYTIPPDLAGIPPPRPAGWPWGSYENEKLRHLAAAAEHWWKNYDPSDSTTAPTIDEVRDWLMARGVEKTPAANIATILRADRLPPGPRKK